MIALPTPRIHASLSSMFSLTITMVAKTFVAGNILAAIIIPTTVSAFANAPWRQHSASYPNPLRGYSLLCTSETSILFATRTAESAVPVTELEDKLQTKSGISSADSDEKFLTIVSPNEGFRSTAISGGTEVSIASMNLLAPFYNSLQLSKKTTSDYERWEFLNNDRTQRVPEAIRMAKRTNADVLCLQEIEGGKLGEVGTSEGNEFTLRDDIREWLAESTTITTTLGERVNVEGYDSFVWSPLNPNNKRGDVVGLCIAWRSKKHHLVEWEGYKRGMVCRLRETDSATASVNQVSWSASFAIANLHLPARPSNVLGRLKTMSRTISKLADLDLTMRKDRSASAANTSNTIDGLIVVAGDFNSDQDSVAARLLSHGYTNYGNVRDRNYKAKVTKSDASGMSHPYRFIDSYDHGADYGSGRKDPRFRDGSNFRDVYAPVTVSLKGRGPGIMDHLFYATGTTNGGKHRYVHRAVPVRRSTPSQVAASSAAASTKEALSESIMREHLGKRSKRRQKGETRGGVGGAAHYINDSKNANVRVEAVLATIDSPGITHGEVFVDERLKIINEGLPNLEEGFPSDHLPVGVLFTAINDEDSNHNQVQSSNLETNDASASVSSNQIAEEEVVVSIENSPLTDISNLDGISGTDNAATTSATQNDTRGGPSGVSASVKRRRMSSKTSFGLRRRHNVVLNAMTEWLVGRGATSVVLDKPLYKNDLISRFFGSKELKQNLKKKSRAPDLVCIYVNADTGDECLVIVEVAVASDPDKVRVQKSDKYLDLVDLSEQCNKTSCLITIVVRDDGIVTEGTRSDVRCLAEITAGSNQDQEEIEVETERLCSHLTSQVSSFKIQ